MSTSRRLRLGLALALAATTAAFQGCVSRSTVATCDSPIAEHGYIAVVVLPYEYGGTKRQLSEAASNLAFFANLQILSTGYRSEGLSVTRLVPGRSRNGCDLDAVEEKLVSYYTTNPWGTLLTARVQHLIIFSGRLYEEGDEIYMQHSARFMQAASARRRIEHTKTVFPSQFVFSETLPVRGVVFPPRRITPAAMAELQGVLARATEMHVKPDRSSRVVDRLRPGADFVVRRATRSGWLDVRLPDDRGGWMTLGDSAVLNLPEVSFFRGLAEFFQYFHAQAAAGRSHVASASAEFDKYLSAEIGPGSRDARAVAKLLGAYLQLDNAHLRNDVAGIRRSGALLDQVVEEASFGPSVRSLATLPRIMLCCDRGEASGNAALDIERSLIAATIADSKNDLALQNLETFYSYLLTAGVAPALAPTALREKQETLRGYKSLLSSP